MAIAPQWMILDEYQLGSDFLTRGRFDPYRTFLDSELCLFSLLSKFQWHDHLRNMVKTEEI